MVRVFCTFMALGLLCSAVHGDPQHPLTATELRVNALDAPLGLDDPAPRFSWVPQSDERGAKQSAYQLLVSSSAERLANDEGELWDSQRVESAATFGVEYAGKPLQPHRECHWKVRLWNASGEASSWSKPVRWRMGFVGEPIWRGEWLGYDAPHADNRKPADLTGAAWLWAPNEKFDDAPRETRGFATSWRQGAGFVVDTAELTLVADDDLRVYVNGNEASIGARSNTPFSLDIAHLLHEGENELRLAVTNSGGGRAGVCARLVVRPKAGEPQIVVTSDQWRCQTSPDGAWRAAVGGLDSLPHATVTAQYGEAPFGQFGPSIRHLPPPVYLRHEFAPPKPVRKAIVYFASLGVADVLINGQRMTEDYFGSGWTDYSKRVYYRAYDVTHLLRSGSPNAIGVVLAKGWYSGHVGWGAGRSHYGVKPRFSSQLYVEFEDGTSKEFATDTGWRAATGGTTRADMLAGETFDARLEPKGWSEPGFDDSQWAPADHGAEVEPVVEAHPAQPVRVIEQFAPHKVTQPRTGIYVLDLGQNFAGVPRLKLHGKPGQRVTLRFAERLNPDGTVYLTNLRGAEATDTYICRGEGEETWQPRFTFHGFQYIEIRGLDAPPREGEIVGLALSSATPVVGQFECSDPMLNRLAKNTYWTQRSNFIDIPTDCPQRDERLGWTGDAQVYIATAALHTDVQAFFDKWLIDLADSQREDGQFPTVAPLKVSGSDGGPAWADAGVVCPWTIYQVYGDRRLLERQYPSMTRFVDFCENRSQDGELPPKEFHAFGDWLSIEADTPKEVIFAAYYAGAARTVALAAAALGKDNDAKRYSSLYERVKRAFNEAYVSQDGRVKGETQTAYSLALVYDLVDGERRQQASEHLVEDILKRGGRLSTGIVGAKDLMTALTQINRHDIGLTLLHNEEFPSWGFSIKHGATSIWERWDGWTPERGFQDAGMNSFAHYSFGAVYRYMVEALGGIQSAAPGYAELRIAPVIDPRLEWAKVRYDSIRGPIQTHWRREASRLKIDLTVPANTTATVALPWDKQQLQQATESGRPLSGSPGVTVDDSGELHLGGGVYAFEGPYAGE